MVVSLKGKTHNRVSLFSRTFFHVSLCRCHTINCCQCSRSVLSLVKGDALSCPPLQVCIVAFSINWVVHCASFYLVCLQSSLLEKINVLSGAAHRDGTCEVLHAAAWIAGEFSEYAIC